MTPEVTHQLATALLLTGLVGLLAVSILVTSFTLLCVRYRRRAALRADRRFDAASSASRPGFQPSIFEPACRWLVVRSHRLGAVQSALALHNPVPCSWGEGVAGLTSRKLFVAPPIHGWILVIGPGLPDPSEDIDRCFHFIRKVSTALGQVQFYSANRPVNHHAWVRAEAGHIQRAYAWAGETLWNQGPITQAELELGMQCLSYGEKAEPAGLVPRDGHPTNSEKVLALATRWSFDPLTVQDSRLHLGLGVAGEVASSRLH